MFLTAQYYTGIMGDHDIKKKSSNDLELEAHKLEEEINEKEKKIRN